METLYHIIATAKTYVTQHHVVAYFHVFIPSLHVCRFTVDAAPALPLFERIWSISTAMFVYIFIFSWGVFHQDQTDEDGKSKDWYGAETLCLGTICSDVSKHPQHRQRRQDQRTTIIGAHRTNVLDSCNSTWILRAHDLLSVIYLFCLVECVL